MPAYTAVPLSDRTILTLIAVACLLMTSCVTSLYPLSENNKGIVYRPELAGAWKEADGNAYIRVEGGEDSAYTLMLVEVRTHDDVSVNDSTYFTGQLVQADGYLFLDCVVDLERQEGYRSLGDYTRAGLAPTHFLFHITIRNHNKVIELGQLQSEPFEKLLREKYPRTRYIKDGESVLLVEPPPGLDRLLVQLLKEGANVWEKSTWVRM